MEQLNLNPNNPREIKKETFIKLKKSLKEFSQMLDIRPIVYDETNTILGGNMRYKALQELETEGFEVKDSWFKCVTNLTEEQKKEFIIKDNIAFGEWDYDALANEWSDLPLGEWGIDTSGWKSDEVIEDEAPEVSKEEPKSKLGEVYQLGRHRLMCGDSTKIEDVEKLMDGNKADMVFTDPPYGMNAVSNSGVLKEKYGTDILNDDTTQVAVDSFKMCQAFGIKKQIWWGANYYSNILQASACWLVWDKNNGGSDQMDCELAWTNLAGVTRKFTQASEKTNRVHPTQKPVKLVAWALNTYGANTVLDLFGGSGSTLIACEQTNRTCYMSELDEKYCDVIRKRYAKFIGKENEWQTITAKI